MRHHYNAAMLCKRKLEASVKTPSAELKVAHDDLSKTVAQCAKAFSRGERLEARNSGLEESCALKETKLKRQAEEMEELKAF